ncbi:MAG: DUF4389 domain-containing protein [Dehalococcoidia bacterium]
MTQPPESGDSGELPTEPSGPPPAAESGQEMLERLRERGLISQEEFEQRQSAQRPAPAPAPGLRFGPPEEPVAGPDDESAEKAPLAVLAATVAAPDEAVPPPGKPPELYPVRFDIEYPEGLSRWKTLLRAFLILPVLLMLGLFQYFTQMGSFIGFTTVFWRKKYPMWLFTGMAGAFGYVARSFSYWLLLTDKFPSFSKEESPVTLEFDDPPSGQLSRWRVFFWKGILLIPHFIVLGFLMIAVFAVTVIAWFGILFTGNYPRGLFQFVVGIQRWYWRVTSYFMSFNDRFPPYALSAEAGPASNGATVANGVIGALVGAGYAALITVAIVLGNNPHTVENLEWAKVQTGQQQPGVTFERYGNEAVFIRLTQAFDPGDEFLQIIQPSRDERIVVVKWSVVNSSRSQSALVTGDAASLKVEYEGDDGKLKTKTIDAVVIGVNNLAAPARIPERGAATINAAFVLPADAVPLELRFRHGFAGTGGIKYVFDQ